MQNKARFRNLSKVSQDSLPSEIKPNTDVRSKQRPEKETLRPYEQKPSSPETKLPHIKSPKTSTSTTAKRHLSHSEHQHVKKKHKVHSIQPMEQNDYFSRQEMVGQPTAEQASNLRGKNPIKPYLQPIFEKSN
mmetsp:Transcript_15485/g.23785  ORF Transcript_15485/g.23785 Transcript_15485/m.23785 type:complete len:133 (+) Transcript_15485:613-1011(+)